MYISIVLLLDFLNTVRYVNNRCFVALMSPLHYQMVLVILKKHNYGCLHNAQCHTLRHARNAHGIGCIPKWNTTRCIKADCMS